MMLSTIYNQLAYLTTQAESHTARAEENKIHMSILLQSVQDLVGVATDTAVTMENLLHQANRAVDSENQTKEKMNMLLESVGAMVGLVTDSSKKMNSLLQSATTIMDPEMKSNPTNEKSERRVTFENNWVTLKKSHRKVFTNTNGIARNQYHTSPKQHETSGFCDYHKQYSHNTEDCRVLRNRERKSKSNRFGYRSDGDKRVTQSNEHNNNPVYHNHSTNLQESQPTIPTPQ
jgi:hypothetical protein